MKDGEVLKGHPFIISMEASPATAQHRVFVG
jgi:hypothetical protein